MYLIKYASGDRILVEMTRAEWEEFAKLSPSLMVNADGATWQMQFGDEIRKLELSTRTCNCLIRGAGLSAWQRPNIALFGMNGVLLEFDEWAKVARARRNELRQIRNMGEKSVDEILAAIDAYLTRA